MELLFDRIGLSDGDVIKQVNNASVTAENAFAIYQAFLDENEIKLNVENKTKGSDTITIQIK